ncbi:MAG TPA: hypothetical protein VGR11_14080 [Solirubrobacteraceae bacterium]|nr:hypothetical protein [Solirubrobacteraceae bacterium]
MEFWLVVGLALGTVAVIVLLRRTSALQTPEQQRANLHQLARRRAASRPAQAEALFSAGSEQASGRPTTPSSSSAA